MSGQVEEIRLGGAGPELYARLRTSDQEAPTIVLLCGLGFHTFEYEPFAESLAASDYNVLSFDYCGRGRSDGPRQMEPCRPRVGRSPDHRSRQRAWLRTDRFVRQQSGRDDRYPGRDCGPQSARRRPQQLSRPHRSTRCTALSSSSRHGRIACNPQSNPRSSSTTPTTPASTNSLTPATYRTSRTSSTH